MSQCAKLALSVVIGVALLLQGCQQESKEEAVGDESITSTTTAPSQFLPKRASVGPKVVFTPTPPPTPAPPTPPPTPVVPRNSCDFEAAKNGNSYCGLWTDSGGDDLDWYRHSGSTSTKGTGPSFAASGSHYLYVESSSPTKPGDAARLGTPPLFIPNNTQVTFAYHMFGSSMGALSLKAGSAVVWSKQGSQGNQWNNATVDLSSLAGQTLALEFVGTRGSSWTGDVAIDNVRIDQAIPSPPPVPTAAEDMDDLTTKVNATDAPPTR